MACCCARREGVITPWARAMHSRRVCVATLDFGPPGCALPASSCGLHRPFVVAPMPPVVARRPPRRGGVRAATTMVSAQPHRHQCLCPATGQRDMVTPRLTSCTTPEADPTEAREVGAGQCGGPPNSSSTAVCPPRDLARQFSWQGISHVGTLHSQPPCSANMPFMSPLWLKQSRHGGDDRGHDFQPPAAQVD